MFARSTVYRIRKTVGRKIRFTHATRHLRPPRELDCFHVTSWWDVGMLEWLSTMKTEGAAASAFPYSLERTVSRRATRNSANNVTRLTTGWSGITVNKSWTGENETKRSRVARLRMYIVLDSLRNEELFTWKTYRQGRDFSRISVEWIYSTLQFAGWSKTKNTRGPKRRMVK